MFNIIEFHQVMKYGSIPDEIKTKAYKLLDYRYMFTTPVKKSYLLDRKSLNRSFDKIYSDLLDGTLDFVDNYPVRKNTV